MLCDARSATNSCRGSTTTTTTRTTTTSTRRMSSIRSVPLALVVLAVLGLPVLMVNASPYGRQRTLRLCSKGLSDALYLVCRDHGGFYEPYSYSGEDYARGPSGGPGLVEECCYRSCSYSQLEQYCKRSSEDKRPDSRDGIEESLRIVNLPYTSTRELATESRDGAAIESNEKITKSKDRNCRKLMEQDKRRKKHGDDSQLGWKGIKIREKEKRRRAKGRARGLDIPDKRHERDDDYERQAALRVCRRRRRRRRRHRGKALREGTIAKVPEFKVGTTLPEPKDSMLLLFPSRTSLGFQRAYKDLANSHGYEDTEKFNSLNGDDLYHEEISETGRSLTANRS